MSVVYLTLVKYLEVLPLVIKWKEGEYRKLFWSVSDKHPGIRNLVNLAEPKYSSLNRERVYQLIALMSLDRVDTITTIVSIDNDFGKSILCGFVYSEVSVNNKYFSNEEDERPNHMIYSHNILTNYLNLGPSMESIDGEYRNQFTDWMPLYKIKNYQGELYAEIIKYLTDKNRERKYTLSRETFFPNSKYKKYEFEFDNHFDQHQIALNMYMIMWYIGVYTKITNIVEDHVNERYLEFINTHAEEDSNFFKSLIVKYSSDVIERVYRYFQNASVPGNLHTTVLGLGQKLTPLNLLEVQNPFDVRFVPWRDYLVTQALSKLAINNICPGFSAMNSWMYVKSAKKGLFNNRIQYQKIERSDQARIVIELLVRSKKYASKYITESSIKTTKGTVTEMFADKFKILHDQIDKSVNFGKNEIIMSNVSLLTVGEYTGRTWNDSIRLAKSSNHYNTALGKPYSSEGYKYFKKYLFDACYNLYCMFTKFGVIHGDLHLNNMTLYQKFDMHHLGFNKIKNPYVIYLVGDETGTNEYCFILPSTTYHVSIIDFGRCFIHPSKLESIRDTSIPKKYEITGNRVAFMKEQVYRLVKTYIRAVPSASDKEPELKILFTKNFDIMYNIMSVLDLFVFLTKLNLVFSLNRPDVVSPHTNCIFLVQKIIELCTVYLVSDVSKLIDDRMYADDLVSRRLPLLEIMLKVFSDSLYDDSRAQAVSGYTIIDVFIYNNPIKYSLTTLDETPEVYKLRKYVDDEGKTVQISSHGIEGVFNQRMKYEKKVVVDMNIIDLISRRHMEKLF